MKKLLESLPSSLNSRSFSIVLLVVSGIIIALLIFQAGIFVGTRKAKFALQWGDNYQRNFGGPPAGFMPDFKGQEFMGGHGAAGSIISFNKDGLVIKGVDNRERIIKLDSSTLIQKGRTRIALKDLKADDEIVVLGQPGDDGTILAKMIRLFSPEDRLPMLPPRPGPLPSFSTPLR